MSETVDQALSGVSETYLAPLFRLFKPMRLFHFQLGERDMVTG